jgi:DNA-binding transcriptional LysR family regulator
VLPDDVRTFQAVARHLSFVRAAGELHVTPQAVSARIRRLERRLGLALFHRTTRQVRLTVEGEVLLGGLSEADAIVDRTLQALRGPARTAAPARLDIGLYDFLPHRIAPRLRSALPGSDLTFHLCVDLDEAVAATERGAYDVLVAGTFGGVDDLPALRQPVFVAAELPTRLMLPRESALAQHPVVPVAEAARLRWAGRFEDAIARRTERVMRGTLGFAPDYRVRASSLEAIFFQVHEGYAMLSAAAVPIPASIVLRPLAVPLVSVVTVIGGARLPPGTLRTLRATVRAHMAAPVPGHRHPRDQA